MAKILFMYNFLQECFISLQEENEVTFPEKGRYSKEELLRIIGDYDVLCSDFSVPVDKELIDKALNLKLIANYGVGYDNIDVAYALEKGIVVTNTPEPVISPTANLALGLMIDAARRISEYDRKLRASGGEIKKGLMDGLGCPVSGQTLGIIGLGRIGKALSKRANACGMEVIYHNRHMLDMEEETRLNVEYASMEELLEKSDFISLHAPLTEQTRHLIGAGELKKMKPTAILINTARGPLIDETALIGALKNGEIQAAALDVFECNDIPRAELLKMDNVVLTPHIGTHTLQARKEMAETVCNNVAGFLKNDRRIYRVLRP